MSNIHYINTQQIRQDLMGFLRQLAAGQEYVVLNRSKPIVTIQGKGVKTSSDAKTNIQELLAIANKARTQAKTSLDPSKSYKQLYSETMAKKYDIH